MRSSVDLPQPEGPSSTRNSPDVTSRLTLSTTGFETKTLVTWVRVMEDMSGGSISQLALNAACRHARYNVTLNEQIEKYGGQGVHQANRHDGVQRRAEFTDEPSQAY